MVYIQTHHLSRVEGLANCWKLTTFFHYAFTMIVHISKSTSCTFRWKWLQRISSQNNFSLGWWPGLVWWKRDPWQSRKRYNTYGWVLWSKCFLQLRTGHTHTYMINVVESLWKGKYNKFYCLESHTEHQWRCCSKYWVILLTDFTWLTS
jgi:hypothetical protein